MTEELLLNVTYSIPAPIVANYVRYILEFKLFNSRLNFSLTLVAHNFTNPNGNFLFGPIQENKIYGFVLTACSFVLTIDCISSQSIFYAKTIAAPQNLTKLSLSLYNSSNVALTWDVPESPNAFSLLYSILRRDSCLETWSLAGGQHLTSSSSSCQVNQTHLCCDGVYFEQKYGFECCDGNYIPKPFDTPTICCGGQFYRVTADYQCCARLYYVYVPPGQICCSNLDDLESSEIR